MTTRDELDAYFDHMFGTPQPIEAAFLNALNGAQPDSAGAELAAKQAELTATLAHERARIADERAALTNQTHHITTTSNPADLAPEAWFAAYINTGD